MHKNNLTLVLTFLFTLLSVFVQAQTVVPIKGIEPQTFYCPSIPKDTLNKVFIKGRVVKKENPKVQIAKAVIQLKGTDIYTVSDSLGYYWLDISQQTDGFKTFTVQCSFINHSTKEVIINHKIIKTTQINFELELNGGFVPAEPAIKPKKKRAK